MFYVSNKTFVKIKLFKIIKYCKHLLHFPNKMARCTINIPNIANTIRFRKKGSKKATSVLSIRSLASVTNFIPLSR